MRRWACALWLAGCLWALATSPSPAWAAGSARTGSGLQLSIITPDPGSIGDKLSLDVAFRGGAVEVVELYLDSALVAKRQFNPPLMRTVITFTLDTTLLTEGVHSAQVRAYGPDGKASVADARIRIPAADLSAPVRISYPTKGSFVSGVVPIRVTLSSALHNQRPYVTFFIDKEFKVLRNYPPYEYHWDTTQVANGPHMLEAWTTLEGAPSPIKARPVHVTVNNGGGLTRKMDRVIDLGALDAPPAVSLPNQSDSATVERRPVGPRLPAGASSARTAEPTSHLGHGTTSLPPATLSAPKPLPQGPAPRRMGGAIVQPKDRMRVADVPKGLLPGFSRTEAALPPLAASRSDSLLKVRPGETLSSISRRTGVAVQEIARLNNLHVSSRLQPGQSLIVPRSGAFEVAFDGNRIAFDVRPRIENGLHLAPFRQIFEHTGGRLYWFGGEAQMVRAVNETREIELKIGQPRATVNNQAIPLERSPFIDTGRTIVPLSFIRDALGVKISFEPQSGRLLIESRK